MSVVALEIDFTALTTCVDPDESASGGTCVGSEPESAPYGTRADLRRSLEL